jgi:hypothetical protein
MKTLNLIFMRSMACAICLVLLIPCQAAEENQDVQSVQINIQKERLQDIRDIASRQRQDIENRYNESLAQLKQEALQQARTIKFLDRIFWTEFISKSCQKPCAGSYIGYNISPFRGDSKVYRLHAAMIDSYFLNRVADFLMNDDARKLLADIVNSDSQNLLIRNKAEELLTIMDYFAAMSEDIENKKESELTYLRIWQECLMDEVQQVIREIESPPKVIPYGSVTAVMHYNKDSFCMIEGIDEIIKAGVTINNAQTKNVKIVKIDTDKAKVEFDRNGKRWAQAVGESPNPGWK